MPVLPTAHVPWRGDCGIFLLVVVLLFGPLDAPSQEADTSMQPTEFMVTSSVDGVEQPCLLWAPAGAEAGGSGLAAPLLVSLHSWSTGHESYDSYAGALEECRKRGWIFLSPHFRGPNNRPEACASDMAVQDVLDAVSEVRKRAQVDARRMYVLGGSGGGHMALVMAHRAPRLWAAVSAWVPVTDLAAWHAFCSEKGYKYAKDVELCIGGPPGDPERDKECRARSPLFWLDRAKGLPVDIQTGIHDGHGGSIPIDHSLRAFNVLAKANGHPEAVFSAEDIAFMTREERVPDGLAGRVELLLDRPETGRVELLLDRPATGQPTDEPGRKHAVVLLREAGPARLTLFDGGHVIDPPPACDWLAKHAKVKD